MYRIFLKDGHTFVSEDRDLNRVLIKNPNTCLKESDLLTTYELAHTSLHHVRHRTNKKGSYVSRESLVFFETQEPTDLPPEDLPIDPYTLGVVLGDARIRKECGSVELCGHVDDFPHYLKEIPYDFGRYQLDKRNPNVRTQSIRGLGKKLIALNLNVHGNHKFIPKPYLYGSIDQRLSLLQGLMDTDGTVSERKINSVASFTSNSARLAHELVSLVYSLGGHTHLGKTGEAVRVQVHLNMPLFRLARKARRHKLNSKPFVAVTKITPIF